MSRFSNSMLALDGVFDEYTGLTRLDVKILSKTNPGPFFRHYDAIAVGFSKNFLSQWEQLNGSQTVSLMCSLVTNQLITDRKGATQIVNNNLLWGVSEQHFFMCTVLNNMESNKKTSKKYGDQQKN